MFYVLLKIQRLCNLLFSNKVAKNESIQDTLMDLRNYVDLLNCTLQDKSDSDPNTPITAESRLTIGIKQS
jgi:hypothetical protein